MWKSIYKHVLAVVLLSLLASVAVAQEEPTTEKPPTEKEAKKAAKKEERAAKKQARKEKRAARKAARIAKRKSPLPIETYPSNGKKYNITGVSLGAELGNYTFQYLDPNMIVGLYYEAHADVQVNNQIYLNAEYGYMERSRNLGFASFYDSDGSYMRFGADYNILHKKTDDDAIFFGFRYALSTFNHEVTYRGIPDFWYDSRPELLNDENLKAEWFELTFGMKARLFWNLYFGITGRIQFVTQQPTASFTVVDIPGHGFEDPNSTSKFNVSYYLTYRIPLWR